ncbi:hypothetical protein VPH35_024206 [Triticum aestivum]
MAGSGAVPLMAGFGAMPRGYDGVVIGVAKAPSTSRGGCCVRQDDVVTDAVMGSSTTRWCAVVIGILMMSSIASTALRRRRQVAAGDPYDDCDIKIRGVNVRTNLDICISMFISFRHVV